MNVEIDWAQRLVFFSVEPVSFVLHIELKGKFV